MVVHGRWEIEATDGRSHNSGARQQLGDKISGCNGANASRRVPRPHNECSRSETLGKQLVNDGFHNQTTAEVPAQDVTINHRTKLMHTYSP